MASLVVLYVLSAAPPILGFGRLLRRAQRDLNATREIAARRGRSWFTFDEFDAVWGNRVAAPLAVRETLIWDLVLVGVGLVAGATASIISLYL